MEKAKVQKVTYKTVAETVVIEPKMMTIVSHEVQQEMKRKRQEAEAFAKTEKVRIVNSLEQVWKNIIVKELGIQALELRIMKGDESLLWHKWSSGVKENHIFSSQVVRTICSLAVFLQLVKHNKVYLLQNVSDYIDQGELGINSELTFSQLLNVHDKFKSRNTGKEICSYVILEKVIKTITQLPMIEVYEAMLFEPFGLRYTRIADETSDLCYTMISEFQQIMKLVVEYQGLGLQTLSCGKTVLFGLMGNDGCFSYYAPKYDMYITGLLEEEGNNNSTPIIQSLMNCFR